MECRLHVLVVEDEPQIAHIVQRALEHDMHVVEVAYDGCEGLDKAEADAFDVIVLDVLLPSLNGVDFCRRLRQERVHTPVLMLTARDAVEHRIQGLDAGADDYLAKPFAVGELQARVRALGRRRHAELGTELLATGNLSVSTRSHVVRRAGQQIELSHKEFALLEYLLRHKGQVMTRDQILEHVWGYDYSPVANVVDIYIHYLRRKIDKGHSEKLIRTVRGVGYSVSDVPSV
jgi:DNA-binding response OmpR family regulator